MSILAIILSFAAAPANLHSNVSLMPTSARAERVIEATSPHLMSGFSGVGLRLGSGIYVRVFKEERELELWVQADGEYHLYKKYPICAISGTLGPKTKEGDNQAPEGFYEIKPDALNPTSFFHLSMNVGYPNAYDRAHKRTGALIMIHGSCVSAGCYAMTDQGIEEIYTIVHSAFEKGAASVPVHIYPFRMTPVNLNRHARDRWLGFWQELRPAYEAFEATKRPPVVDGASGHYAMVPEVFKGGVQ